MDLNNIYGALLNLPNVSIEGLRIEKNAILIDCSLIKSDNICPHCGQINKVVNDTKIRTLQDLNISGREVFLSVKVRQFYCLDCDKYHTEILDFADSHKSYTHRQSKFIFLLCKKQTYKEVGAIMNLNSKTVERIVLKHSQALVNRHEAWSRVKRIGIDEQSHRKGKGSYFCILTDLDSGVILEMLPDRKKQTLVDYFQSLGEEICTRITDVSCDIWSTYIQVARQCLSQARIVLDRFHVVKLLNESLDNYRKTLRKAHKDNDIFKRLKWILYKQHHMLTDRELDDLEASFKEDPKLKAFYFKRDAFHQILDNNTDVNQAVEQIKQWIKTAKEDGLTIFDKFSKTVQKWKINVANYVKDKVTNATTEGLNNLIRVVKRFSYGMPNFEHLRLRALVISNDFH